MTLEQIYAEFTTGSRGFVDAVQTYCGLDVSDAEIERIASRATGAESFLDIWENDDSWRDGYVTDANGNRIDFAAAANLMDDDLREEIHSNYAPGYDNEQAFLEEYARRHEEKFGEAFAPYSGEAW